MPIWFEIGGWLGFDAWLYHFLETYQVKRVSTEEHARTGRESLSLDKIYRNFTERLRASGGIVQDDEDDQPSQSDHIPALRGLFAIARGNYAAVSPDDLRAAADAGYLHPDVLSSVADEIAYATEIESLKGYQKGLLRRFPMEPQNAE